MNFVNGFELYGKTSLNYLKEPCAILLNKDVIQFFSLCIMMFIIVCPMKYECGNVVVELHISLH